MPDNETTPGKSQGSVRKRVSTYHALNVPCPHCGAGTCISCRSPRGNSVSAHAARRQAYLHKYGSGGQP